MEQQRPISARCFSLWSLCPLWLKSSACRGKSLIQSSHRDHRGHRERSRSAPSANATAAADSSRLLSSVLSVSSVAKEQRLSGEVAHLVEPQRSQRTQREIQERSFGEWNSSGRFLPVAFLCGLCVLCG